ncbi:hypothetical protein CC86DRAFT_410574 [Ophiobolus disseminans]|uniref:Uncharacterized protein n=1 Tax=Ophiobolus disseminans TaxID=1469910 RepID=A0A6A6ZPM1_9PLEO|nr:hypothetical protein CC86DRAFT_410574 [Ophiobolus disseminans]
MGEHNQLSVLFFSHPHKYPALPLVFQQTFSIHNHPNHKTQIQQSHNKTTTPPKCPSHSAPSTTSPPQQARVAPHHPSQGRPPHKFVPLFCGPKTGSHASPLPQHYLAYSTSERGATSEHGAQAVVDTVKLLAASATGNDAAITKDPATIKDPATSATVEMTSSVAEDVRRLENELKGPITTVWADGYGDGCKEEGNGEGNMEAVGAVRLENGDWEI